MSLTFRPHTDQGAPRFYRGAEEPALLGLEIKRGERGRWLADAPAPPGLSLTLSGALRPALSDGEAEVVLVFWRDEPGYVLHSTQRAFALAGTRAEFTPFAYCFAPPPGVKGLRVDVRAWTGSGVVEARGLALREDETPDAPPPGTEPGQEPGLPIPRLPEWPLQKVAGYRWGDNLCLVFLAEEAQAAQEQGQGENGRG